MRDECVIRFVGVRGGYKAMNGGVHVRDAYRGGGVCLLLGVRHIHLCWSGDRDNAHCHFGFCSLEGHVPHQWQFSKEGAVGEQVENNATDCELSDGTHNAL